MKKNQDRLVIPDRTLSDIFLSC